MASASPSGTPTGRSTIACAAKRLKSADDGDGDRGGNIDSIQECRDQRPDYQQCWRSPRPLCALQLLVLQTFADLSPSLSWRRWSTSLFSQQCAFKVIEEHFEMETKFTRNKQYMVTF